MGQAFPDPRIYRGDQLDRYRCRLYSHNRPQVGGYTYANANSYPGAAHGYGHTHADSDANRDTNTDADTDCHSGAAHGYGHSYANQHPNPDSFAHTCACAAYPNPNTHSQHMGRPQHVRLGAGGTRSGDAGGDGRSPATNLGQQTGR